MHQGITRIEVRGFKSFKDLAIDLRPLNLLIGANAAGKSNFLALLRMINAITDQRLQAFVGAQGGSPALLHLGPKQTPRLDLTVHCYPADFTTNRYHVELVHVAPGKLIFAEEIIEFETVSHTEPQRVRLGGGHEETRLPDKIQAKEAGAQTAKFIKYQLDRWRAYHFHDTSDQARVKQPAHLSNNRFLLADAGNLASFLYMLRGAHAWHYEQIRDAVRQVYVGFDDFLLEPSRLNKEMIVLAWREKGSDYEFGVHQASDGSLRFMCLATLLLQPFEHRNAPFTITLDEPELGLHPYAIGLLADMLKQAATKAQIIVATQSAALLAGAAEPDDTLVVARDRETSTIRRLTEDELRPWLENYSLGEAWEKGAISGAGPQG